MNEEDVRENIKVLTDRFFISTMKPKKSSCNVVYLGSVGSIYYIGSGKWDFEGDLLTFDSTVSNCINIFTNIRFVFRDTDRLTLELHSDFCISILTPANLPEILENMLRSDDHESVRLGIDLVIKHLENA